jgi:hypothetical protein
LVRHHRILGMIFDEKFDWKELLQTVKARPSKKLNLLKTLAPKKWGGDQKTLLKLHQMVVLSTLRYSETVYGSASKSALRTIEPVHHKGVKIALFKTENALCEAGLSTLTEMRELNTKMVATRILTNRDHPIRHFFMDSRIQGEYAKKAGTPQPIFMEAIEIFGNHEIDERKVEITPDSTTMLS